MATLPRPDVAVTQPSDYMGKERLDVMISRDNKGKSYSSEAATATERVKEVVEKIINDPTSIEFLP